MGDRIVNQFGSCIALWILLDCRDSGKKLKAEEAHAWYTHRYTKIYSQIFIPQGCHARSEGVQKPAACVLRLFHLRLSIYREFFRNLNAVRASHKISRAAAAGGKRARDFFFNIPPCLPTTWKSLLHSMREDAEDGRTNRGFTGAVQSSISRRCGPARLRFSLSLSLSLGVMWPRVCTNPPLICRTGNTFSIFASVRFSCVLLCDSLDLVRPRLSPSSTIEFVRLRGGLHQTHTLPGGHAFIRDVQESVATVRLVSHFGGQLARWLFYFFLSPSPHFLFPSRFLPTPLVTHTLVLHTTMS